MQTAKENLVALLEQRSEACADQVAFTYLVDGERTEQNLTYGELARKAKRIATLASAHAKPGDRIVLLYPPGLDYISAFFGCLYGGFVAVPAYPPDPSRLSRTMPRLQAIVSDAGADVVLTDGAVLGMTEILSTIAPDLGKKRWMATDGLGSSLDAAWRHPDIGPDTLAFLQYTSGSTGLPKGVMLTHDNLLANERMIQQVFKLTPESIGVGWLPLYHDMGLIGNVLQPVYTGFRCVLMSPLSFLHRPLRWLEAISRYRGTGSGAPNFAYDLCLRKITAEDRQRLDLTSWKLAFSGAEPVRYDTLDAFAKTFAECGFRREAFLPCYGLAEASLIVSGKTMGTPYRVANLDRGALEEGRAIAARAVGEGAALVSNGPPVDGTHVVVVDPVAHTECAEGRIGEIWVSGPHVARGYWQDREKTERTFGARLAGGRLRGVEFLRTGDLGFFQDGELFISGRLKDLIIIRGRNYYPQDIERVVEESYPTLRRGCAAAFSLQVDGEERLVVAVEVERRVRTADRRAQPSAGAAAEKTASTDRRASEPPPGAEATGRAPFQPEEIFAAIRRATAEHFGLHVHRIALLKAGSIPKTSSGKLQRRACCSAYLDGTLDLIEQSQDEEPTSEMRMSFGDLQAAKSAERMPLLVAYLQAELARTMRVPPSRVDVDAPLSSLGLDSLMAVESKHAVERTLGITLPVTAFLRDGCTRDLAATILPMLTFTPSSAPGIPPGAPARVPSQPPSARRDPESPEFPLSPGQQALWFLQRLAPASSAYNLATALRVEGDLVAPAIERALRALVARHPALHTTYADVDGTPMQTLRPELAEAFALELHDASTWTEEELPRRLADVAHQPFDLARGPIFRAALFRRGRTDHVLCISVHHIAADLWSIVLLLSELQTIYPAVRAGRDPASLLSTGARYREFVARQQAYLQTEGEVDWLYWEKQLRGVPDLDLQTDRPRPRMQAYAGATHRVRFAPELVVRLSEFARREGVTVYVVLLAMFQVLLSRHTGQSSFLVGSPIAGRPTAAYDRVVGFFVNALPMRADLRADPTVRQLLRRVRDTVLEALEHQSFPFASAVERLRGPRDPSRSPLFQAMFALEKAYLERESDVTMLVLDASDQPVDYAGMKLRACSVEHRTAQFDLTLNLAHAEGVLAGTFEYNTDLFDPSTIRRLAAHFETLLRAALVSPEQTIARLPLLTDAERTEIDAWNATGVRYAWASIPQRFEAQVDRRPDAEAVSFEGASMSYRTLDESASRLAHALTKQGVRAEDLVAVLMDRSIELVVTLMAILKAGAVYVPIDPAYPPERVAFMLADCDARVVVTQKHLRHALQGTSAVAILADADLSELPVSRPPLRSHPGSGAYMIYTSGSTGRPKGALNTHGGLSNRLEWMQQALGLDEADAVLQKTSFSFDVSVWEFFWPLIVGARLVVAKPGGHKDPAYLCRLIETTRVTTLHFVPSMLESFLESPSVSRCGTLKRVICSGEALPYALARRFHERISAELHNLYGPTEAAIDVTWWQCRANDAGPTVPIGKPIANTQIHILDAEMQPVPIGVAGELYIGGVQLARGYWRRPELTAERFVTSSVGRERLYRTGDLAKWRADGAIEYLGRTDHQLKLRGFRIELGEIEGALRDLPGVRDAIAVAREDSPGNQYLVAYVVGTANASELRLALAQRLPEYMIPSAFVTLGELPLTPNGKVDRNALPAPEMARGDREFHAPETAAEKYVANLFSSVLGVERIGMDDDFFELGGHSLLATRVVSRLGVDFGVSLELKRLFERSTPAGVLILLDESFGGRETTETLARTLASGEEIPEAELAEMLRRIAP